MREKLKKIFSDVFDIQMDVVNDESSMKNISEWDSLNHMVLISSIEEHFNVLFEAEEIVGMVSFVAIEKILKDRGIN